MIINIRVNDELILLFVIEKKDCNDIKFIDIPIKRTLNNWRNNVFRFSQKPTHDHNTNARSARNKDYK